MDKSAKHAGEKAKTVAKKKDGKSTGQTKDGKAKGKKKAQAKPQKNGKQDKVQTKDGQGKAQEKPQDKRKPQTKGKQQGKQEKGKKTAEKAVAKRGRPALVTVDTKAYQDLLKKCRELITNTERMVIENYWRLGEMVNGLKDGDRAAYGQKTVAHLADDLGRSKSTLDKCAQFHQTFTKDELRKTLHNLRWTHLLHLLTVQDDKKRKQLMDQAVSEEWTTTRLAEEVAKATGGSGKVLQLTDSGFSRIQKKVVGLNTLLTDDFLTGLDAENSKETVDELESLYNRIGQILEKVRQAK